MKTIELTNEQIEQLKNGEDVTVECNLPETYGRNRNKKIIEAFKDVDLSDKLNVELIVKNLLFILSNAFYPFTNTYYALGEKQHYGVKNNDKRTRRKR